MKLEDLPYPMFKITLNDAFLLTEARKRLVKRKGSYQLSNQVSDVGKAFHTSSEALRKRISGRLTHWTLYDHLRWHPNTNMNEVIRIWKSYESRVIWIDKLLKHNGYK